MDNKKKYEKIFIKALSIDKSTFSEKIVCSKRNE